MHLYSWYILNKNIVLSRLVHQRTNSSNFGGAFYNANHRQHNLTSSTGKSRESNIDKSGNTVVTNEKRLLPRNNHAILTLKVSRKEDMAVEICTLRLICLWTPCGLPFKCSL